ncbi:MAG: conjugal transfer protein TraR [Firmicutes bacterium]|nr:conjugal transfer protein TraR [Bacillota bacterium]
MVRSELDYGYFSRLLQKKKDELLKFKTREEAGKHISLKESTSELSMFDNHPADMGSELFERSKDLSLHRLRLGTLADIEAALKRIADGSYGRCIACGKQIDKERLEVLPYAKYCLICQGAGETKGKRNGDDRPAEESVLSPPFKRTFLDGSDYTGYDGEDAWQDVARYGTSDSPQDVPGDPDYPAFVDSAEDSGIVDKMDKLPSTLKDRGKKENRKEEGDAGGKKRN